MIYQLTTRPQYYGSDATEHEAEQMAKSINCGGQVFFGQQIPWITILAS